MLKALDILEVEQLAGEDTESATSIFNEVLERVANHRPNLHPQRLPNDAVLKTPKAPIEHDM